MRKIAYLVSYRLRKPNMVDPASGLRVCPIDITVDYSREAIEGKGKVRYEMIRKALEEEDHLSSTEYIIAVISRL